MAYRILCVTMIQMIKYKTTPQKKNIKTAVSQSYYLNTTNRDIVCLRFVRKMILVSSSTTQLSLTNTLTTKLIRRTLQYLQLDAHMFVLLYKLLIRSQLEYASSILHPYKKNHHRH